MGIRKGHNLKFVVIGDSTVGKTSLLVTYADKKFPCEYMPTAFDLRKTYEDKDIELFAMDTAGGEEYDHLRPLAYPNTDVFLLCFNLVNPTSFDNIKQKWSPEVNQHCSKVPVLFVGTKLDFQDDRDAIESLKDRGLNPIQHYQGEQMKEEIKAIGYFECSSLIQKGLDELFEEATQLALCWNKKQDKKKCRIS